MNKSRKIVGILSAILFIIAISFFSRIITFLSDYNWFKEVGYTAAFFKQVFSKLYIGVPLFFILSMLIYIYLISIKRSYYRHMNITSSKGEDKTIRLITIISSLIISVLYSSQISSNLWMEILQFKNATLFNVKDPIFHRDVSFYVFKLPLINEIFNILSGMLVFLFVLTFIYYVIIAILNRSNVYQKLDDNVININGFDDVKGFFRKVVNLALSQLTIIAVIFFIIIGLKNYLAAFELLYSPRGVAYGAGYTDVNITLLVYRIQSILAIISAIFFTIAYKKKRLRIALIGPILLIGLGIGASLIEAGVQNFIVAPNELAKEKKFLEYNINYTKMAYNLDKVKEEDFIAEQNISINDVLGNEETLKNISINDYRPTKESYNQLQSLRSYYTFNDVDADRYEINGKLRQVFIAPREIDQEQLDDKVKTWVNKHLKYTHGYGVVMSPVNEVTAGGEPSMVIKNIPPVSTIKSLNITRPEIYFGEFTNDYIITNTSEKEFDYPKGETNAFTEYKGNAGIKLNFQNKLLYAINQNSLKMLVSTVINNDSKIILNRNIKDRVEKIAPFLSFDENPYMILDNGKLYWIIDGYTYTDKYPYSQPYSDNRINYIRNSFKVVIDAYNGNTDFYIMDKNDPMVKTYSKIFPSIFKDIDKMPMGIKNHLKYPQTLFEIQAKTYATYHMEDTGVFYNKEDKWQVARDAKRNSDTESNYNTFKLPNEKKAEFLLTIPYTPNKKQNMTGLLVARNNADKYGQLVIYEFPKEKIILGPAQVEAKIDNEPEISKNLTQWSSGGSKVIRGHLLTIPIENSILYVEPLYIKSSSSGSIPEVKKILVAYKDKVVMEDSLEKALNAMFDGSNVYIPKLEGNKANTNTTPSDLIKQANDLYEKAQTAIKEGNFGDYGKYISELGNILKQLKK